MGIWKVAAIGIGTSVTGLALIGSNVRVQDRHELPSPFGEAKDALRVELVAPEVKELHYFAKTDLVCGLVKHKEAEVGIVPFAYTRKLGLAVAPVWGRDEPEKLNRRYGCDFLPLAYSDRWVSLFWGGAMGDSYQRDEEAL